jgi:transposase
MDTIVGIDVAKEELVIYANEKYYTVSNTEKSLQHWISCHAELVRQISLFVFEPTGGYEKILAKFLEKKGLPACRAHANHVRAYAKSIGYLAKTDKIDAKIIAEFAHMRKLSANVNISEHETLHSLMNRREQIIELIKQESNRLETLTTKWVIQDIKAHVKHMKDRLKKLEATISEYVTSDPKLKGMTDLMTTIPGVGFVTAVSLLVYLPEIFDSSEKKLGALAGLAPMNHDSGKTQKKRRIQGGRSQVRRVLYMSALSAKQWNPVIRDFFNRLAYKGKFFKVAITAAMRKLLMIIRSVLLRGVAWQTEAPEFA